MAAREARAARTEAQGAWEALAVDRAGQAASAGRASVVPAPTTHAAAPTTHAAAPTTRAEWAVGVAARAELRLRSIREGRLLAGPETLQLNLQNACNGGCIFCWNHSPLLRPRSPSWHRERLSDAHLAAILDPLPRLAPDHVLLSGQGEPLLYPRVRELLTALRRLAIPVTVQTNGIAGLAAEELVDLGVEQLLVNVSAGTAAGYERVHPGHGAAFSDVVSRLERIAELRGRNRTPRTSLVAVIQRTNLSEIGALVELAARVGAEAVQLRGMEPGEGLGSLRLGRQERERVRAEAEPARARAQALGLEIDDAHLVQLLGSSNRTGAFTESLRAGPCFIGWAYLRVTSDGRVMFCCKDKLVDHLDRTPLYRIWRSAGYQLLRLGGRDGDLEAGPFDDRCCACSNFRQNELLAAALRPRAEVCCRA
jgi:wyosine [tRNA(Phe)-imidazoG37] synthetase (radical SAM superfamily)